MAPRRTHAEMKAETRSALIGAARKAFAEQGYANASMDALCESAGVTRGALYHHFGGKDGLLEAVVRQIDSEIGTRLEAHYAKVEDPWEAFCACNIEYLRLALDPEIQQILLRDAPAVLGQRMREIDEESSIAPLVAAIEDLIAQGRMRPCDPQTIARMLNGALVDAALWIAAADPNDKEEAEARFSLSAESSRLLMNGLAPSD